MSWTQTNLGKIINISKGKAITKKDSKEGPYPVILGGREPAYYIDKYNHTGKAVVVSRSGASAGYVSFWNEPIFVTDGFLIEPKSEVSIDYLYYLMKAHECELMGLQGGSAIPHVTPKIINGISVSIPNNETQSRIANILAKYDDLIENNQKQIKLLEEAAQRLYKEWFADLRFPGYENCKIVDGVPIEWGKGSLGDIAIDSGLREKKENRQQYEYYLPIDCLPKKSFAYTETSDIELAESSLVAFKENDILFGAMRPYFHKVVFTRDKGLTRSTCFVINAKQKEYWAFLLMLMFSDDTVNFATKISVGTTMPYVRWKDMVSMPITIPSKGICKEFCKVIIPITERISKLAKQNTKLIELRDCLLTRLMNGEIEV